jgi:hypothetical protein
LRINGHPYDTQIISIYPIDNSKKGEREIIREFKSEFEFRNDIDNEYFEGNERDMISVFNNHYSNHSLNRDEKIDMDYH